MVVVVIGVVSVIIPVFCILPLSVTSNGLLLELGEVIDDDVWFTEFEVVD